jgi:hypothetical protein
MILMLHPALPMGECSWLLCFALLAWALHDWPFGPEMSAKTVNNNCRKLKNTKRFGPLWWW